MTLCKNYALSKLQNRFRIDEKRQFLIFDHKWSLYNRFSCPIDTVLRTMQMVNSSYLTLGKSSLRPLHKLVSGSSLCLISV